MHASGKIVAVWLDNTAPYVEDEAFYEKVYDLHIDMLTTDFPEKANAILEQIHSRRKAQSVNAQV